MNSKNIQSVNIMEFSSENIQGNQVGTFIMHLYQKENFSHIGYHKNDENDNWIIHTRSDNKRVIKYFKRSSPEVIRRQCEQTSFEPHCIISYTNDYKEVSEFEA